MKRITYLFLIAFAIVLGFTSCKSCNKTADNTASVVSDTTFVVENVISTDKEYMFTNYNQDYRWYETCIVLKDFLDDENCDGTIEGISNIFQVITEIEKDKCYDTNVVMITHTPDTTATDVKHGFWVEDYPLNNEEIKVTFKEAYDKVMATNSPKPHSKHVVLRKEVGSTTANVQYIFGNNRAQLYVDAVNGTVSDKNPVFPEAEGFKMPLGEWP